MTSTVERLGNPLVARWPGDTKRIPRNVWDMQRFKGRIYLGSGNSSDAPPAQNAGPCDVWALDPATGEFSAEATLPTEAIEKYRVIDGELFVPVHDGKVGNVDYFYRRDAAGAWVRYPGWSTHCYDVLRKDGWTYLGIGTAQQIGSGASRYGILARQETSTSASYVSVAWTTSNPALPWVWVYRIFTLFEFDGAVWGSGINHIASTAAWEDGVKYELSSLAKVTGQKTAMAYGQPESRNLFPGHDLAKEPLIRIERPVVYRDRLVYLGGLATNDHAWFPRGLFVATRLGTTNPADVRRVSLPSTVTDLVVGDDGVLYALGYVRRATRTYSVTIHKTDDLEMWTKVLEFDSRAFGRSFEVVDGAFYIGIGCDVGEPDEHSGDILRVTLPAPEPEPEPTPEPEPEPAAWRNFEVMRADGSIERVKVREVQ